MKNRTRRLCASLLLGGGIATTALLGALAGADQAPSTSTNALLVVIAAFLQLASAAVFNSVGRADPTLARTAVRRLLRMRERATEARRAAETAFDDKDAREVRRMIGVLSVELSVIEEGCIDAVQTWTEFHADALQDLLQGDQQ